jgi:hypothetical protein
MRAAVAHEIDPGCAFRFLISINFRVPEGAIL